MTILIFLALSLAFLVPLVVGKIALAKSQWFTSGQRRRADNKAVQASHRGNPLRLGGLIILVGCFCSAAVVSGQSSGEIIILILFSALPAFIAGFLEDIGYFVRPVLRLMAAFLSSGIVIYSANLAIPGFEIMYLDQIFSYFPAAVVLTILFAGIFCHSLNIVDGLNGLAAQVIICAAVGLTVIGFGIDFKQLAGFCLILAFATLSFGYFNWPQARLFLGDAGSYGIAHILVWIAIFYLNSNKSVVFPAMLLVLFWPIAEIVHTVARRILTGKNIFHPDNLHTHQKMKRLAEKMLARKWARRYSNPIASLFLLPMISLPPLVGVLTYQNALYAWVAVSIFFIMFCVNYHLLGRYEHIFKRD